MADKESVHYPITSFRFTVEIEPKTQSTVLGKKSKSDASFQEISGISVEIPVEEIKEGGENRFVHRAPQPLKYPNLVLKRGVVDLESSLTDWCNKTINSGFAQHVQLKDVTVNLMNDENQIILSWTFRNAYPVKWEYSTLNASKNEIFVQTIELVYQYFEES